MEEAVLDAPVEPVVETPATPTAPAAAATAPESEIVLDLGITKPSTPKDLSDEELAKLPENDARKWGREWKTTATSYKEAHEVAQSFGGVQNVKTLKSVHDAFIAPDLDPQTFFGELSKIDPQRAAQLMTFAGSKAGGNTREEVLTELFGSIPTKKDIELFRTFKAADGKLISVPGGDPIPERFLYREAVDEDTEETVKTLRTQKEIDADPDYKLWKEVQQQRQEYNQRTEKETREKTQAEQQRLTQERAAQVDAKIDEWHKPLDLALEQLGMIPIQGDAPEVLKEKNTVIRILSGMIRETFSQTPEYDQLLQTASQYIRNGRADLVDSLGISDRLKGIVADTVIDGWNLLKGGIKPRARAVQAAVTKQQAPNPVVNGSSGGLGQTKIEAPANMNDSKAVTAWMNQIHAEAVAKQMRPAG